MKARFNISELVLLLATVVLSVSLALVIIRWLAPGLLGAPNSLKLVKLDRAVPPFYENIFREEDWTSTDYLIQDPIVQVRAKPLFFDLGSIGPNDLLGFRNKAVPNSADVITIGDSQTYGNNVLMWKNWPHALESMLPQGASVYSFATGGWGGGVQYYSMFLKALLFSPQVIIVAFYTGNDPLETYSLATASGLWKKFVPAGNLSDHEIPSPDFPAPDDEIWPVVFADGIKTAFTPRLRHASNMDHPVVDIGYTIMARIAEGMADVASRHDVRIVFTIIPTKEYVYAEKVKSSGIEIDPDYHQLVTDEKRRIRDFSSRLEKLDGAKYADVITALQKSALTAVPLYPENQNGHPVEPGYRVIATELEKAIKPYLTDLHNGFYFSRSDNGHQYLVYIEDGKFWLINNPEFVADKKPKSISSKRLSSMLFSGLLTVATQ